MLRAPKRPWPSTLGITFRPRDMPLIQLTPREPATHLTQIVTIHHQTLVMGLYLPAAVLQQGIALLPGVGQGMAASPMRKMVGVAHTGVQVADQGAAAKPVFRLQAEI